MSFRINTNVQALGALRNLGVTSMEAQKSMTRLSTGLRINSAADDPAGLIVSENFRAQITGIDQALRNNQDASNYAKTAEGALGEVNRLLNDARSLAVASGNGSVLTDSQRQANQQQLNSIINSIDRIASTTTFGGRRLLDGSAGVQGSVVSAADVGSINLSGTWDGSSITGASLVTVTVTTAAERASVASAATWAADTAIGTATTLSVNGVSLSVTAGETMGSVVQRLNALSGQTGVTALIDQNENVLFQSQAFGENAQVTVTDTGGIIVAGSASDTGVDAVADVEIDADGAGPGTSSTVSFDQGTGLTLRDRNGNSVSLTEVGNGQTGAIAAGQTIVGSSRFQIGGNVGDTASLSIGNFAAGSLGNGIVSGTTMANISMLTNGSAEDALRVIDKAIEEVSSSRGRIGNFVRNTIETNIRSLSVARENLAASESSIRDIDVAQEMTNFTKLQILQQSGMSMLAQANAAPQSVLSLLR